MITITYNKAIEFNEAAKRFFQSAKKETAFSEALNCMLEVIRPYFEDKGGYNQRANKINRSTAAKDSKNKGVLLVDPFGMFQYTEAGLERRDEMMDELGEQTIEIEAAYCYDVPELSLADRKIFTGIVIDPDIKEEINSEEKILSING